MFAIMGLLGLALAGTAFVGLSETADRSDAAPIPTDEDQTAKTGEEAAENASEPTFHAAGAGAATVGTDALDEIFAGPDANSVLGLGGDDYIDGEAGNDTLSGGTGHDQLYGGAGDDSLLGGAGDDQLFGSIGHDNVLGGDGDDRLIGGDGDDLLDGAYDDDELLGGYGDDTLIGGAGADVLQGSEGHDLLDGTIGEDTAEKDYLNGGYDDDTLIGGDEDVLSGGPGADTFVVASGAVEIMDFDSDDTLVLRYTGEPPQLTTIPAQNGLTLLANGEPVAHLRGLATFDVGTVSLVAA